MADETRVFVDTNVLVYARDASEPEKQPRAAAWMETLWQRRAGRISVQVLEEFYVTVTSKLDRGLEPEEARSDVRALEAWRPLPLDADLLGAAWDVEDRYGFAFWDALIVAGARRAGCRYLLSEDLQSGQDLSGVEVVDPFVRNPDGLLLPAAGPIAPAAGLTANRPPSPPPSPSESSRARRASPST